MFQPNRQQDAAVLWYELKFLTKDCHNKRAVSLFPAPSTENFAVLTLNYKAGSVGCVGV